MRRSASGVSAYEYPRTNLVAEWLFSGNADDTSGNGNDATVVGPTLATDRYGNSSQAYSFDGIDDYIYGPPISISGDISMVCWCKSADFKKNMFMISKMPVNTQWGVFWDDISFNRGVLVRGGGATHIDTSGHTPIYPTNNDFHLIVATITGTTGKLYVDGDEWASGTVDAIANGTVAGTNDVLIGQYAKTSGSFSFNGVIDDCLLYDAVLTPTEITAMYNGSKP